jgi:asparagine synthase (glutamine-hydrolysing)
MFTVPVGEWFKGKLKNYLIEIILSESLERRGIFNINYLKKLTNEHFEGVKDRTRELRAIVNLEIWFRKFIDS